MFSFGRANIMMAHLIQSVSENFPHKTKRRKNMKISFVSKQKKQHLQPMSLDLDTKRQNIVVVYQFYWFINLGAKIFQ